VARIVLAGVLLFTPSYGIGVAISPLTLIGSWIALSPLDRASRAIGLGAAFNLLLVVAGLSLLTAVWAPVGLFWLALAWTLVAVIVVVACTALLRRGRVGKQLADLR
jgi:hypothetical protein